MSASAAKLLPQSAPLSSPHTSPERQADQRLYVVAGQKVAVRSSVWPFILIAVLLVVFTIALPMVVNTQMAQRAYEIRDQQIVLAELNAQVETLEAELLEASSPQKLEERARSIGLVHAGSIGAISLDGKKVEGGGPAQ
ncbi:FtsB family cell division protein [Actinomyces minihominis]|uniref:FtsB family cell division protein n=1 Tax=Actinomyces minihominis TaxID=2002838 RepID=UPI000C06F0BF|nr:hypothetical protein [Actinomyces minihominis]